MVWEVPRERERYSDLVDDTRSTTDEIDGPRTSYLHTSYPGSVGHYPYRHTHSLFGKNKIP